MEYPDLIEQSMKHPDIVESDMTQVEEAYVYLQNIVDDLVSLQLKIEDKLEPVLNENSEMIPNNYVDRKYSVPLATEMNVLYELLRTTRDRFKTYVLDRIEV